MIISPLDVLAPLVVVWNMIKGWGKGFVGEAFSVISFLVSVFVAFKYSPAFAELFLGGKSLKNVLISGAIIYVSSVWFFRIVEIILKKFLSVGGLDKVNRIFGAIFGALKGVFVVFVLFFIVLTTVPQSNLVKKSYILKFFKPFVSRTVKHFSKRFL